MSETPPPLRAHPLELRLPPPLVALVFALAMSGLARLTPALPLTAPLRAVLAAVLLSAGLAVALLAVWQFRRAGTTVHPLRPQHSTALVRHGIYRYSRNPMYLGMALVLLAWSVWLAAPLALLGVIGFIAWIQRFQIRPEERVLAARFAAAYSDYCQRTRRWI